MKPSEFWSSPEAARWWQLEDDRYREKGVNAESEEFLSATVRTLSPKSALEVGAGTGRLIGRIAKEFPGLVAHSGDINADLCALVHAKYPVVEAHHFTETLPFADRSIDLVYTYQVLQHMPPNEMRRLLGELFRVARSKVLVMEGYMPGNEDGEMTHPANGGSFFHDFQTVLAEREYESGELHGGKIRYFLIPT